ncbi:hypothetical protein BPT24_173 [Tenacibaculum phage pT24]|uniref:Uncharacterized protein n=1 Tax=Tenacibaculum phage pT24 TaxID=1880590 RepID=A0A1B4XWX2_9CAUD|nr:hypothetical protein HYP10_gp173 [Tenacibaculum phage pT24]BAV39299.1 hypothetical protein BPT24_173 [Tenacibaculum phage pT24]
MINSPVFSTFKTHFPADFFKSSIVGKYNEWMSIYKGNIETIQDLLNFSIQSIKFPDLGNEPILQQIPVQGGVIDVNTKQVKPRESLIDDKTFTITFKHIDGFKNYFLLYEHYFQYAENKNGDKPDYSNIPDMNIEIYDIRQNLLFVFNLQGVQFTGMDGLDLTKSSLNAEFDTFTCTFAFNSFRVLFNTPEKADYHD